MMDISEVLRQANGEIVGKIKLQKIVYLLDRLGFDTGFKFEYHHYGPYSRELSDKVEDEVASETITSVTRRRQGDGVPYVVYQLPEGESGKEGHSAVYDAKMGEVLGELNRCSSTILELAATIDWLYRVEGRVDWEAELRIRKGAKTADGRKERALRLLDKLGLQPSNWGVG